VSSRRLEAKAMASRTSSLTEICMNIDSGMFDQGDNQTAVPRVWKAELTFIT